MNILKIGTLLTGIITSFSFVSAMDMTDTSTSSMMKDDMKKSSTTMHADIAEGTMGNTGMYDTITSSSKKADIVKLQMMLVEKGHLTMPKGVAYGYYGMLTKKAVMKYKSVTIKMKDDIKKSDSMMNNDMKKDTMMH